ncbi:MAG: hypothetical protein CFE21_08275 [Bacteroidetes bacterium B1(2017)]|nr:MAG: hypothetical protein CFE21_08275 [Bacteroidetes bacterium B1(2017)]
MKKLVAFLCLGLCINTPKFLTAQTAKHPWAFGMQIGISEYRGDLGNGFFDFAITPSNFYDADMNLIQRNSPGIAGVSITRYLNSSFDASAYYNHGEWGYHSSDNSSFFFKRINSVDMLLKWKFLGSDLRYITPYIATGLGYRNVHLTNISNTLQHELTLPLAIGINLKFNSAISLQAQTQFAFTSADAGDNIEVQLPIRNDQFLNHTIGILITPGNLPMFGGSPRDRCPKL